MSTLPNPELQAGGDAFTHTQHDTAVRASSEQLDSRGGEGTAPLVDHTLTDTHSCARLLASFSNRLVVAHTPGTDLRSSLYVVDPATGLVSINPDQILALSMQVADNLLVEYEGLEKKMQPADDETAGAEGLAFLPSKNSVINHARGLRSARAADRHQRVVGGVLEHARQTGVTLASRLAVRPHSAIDADMSVIGTPGRVLDIRSRQILPPCEGGTHFISRSTGVESRRDARDPRVDRILPSPSEVDHNSRLVLQRRVIW